MPSAQRGKLVDEFGCLDANLNENRVEFNASIRYGKPWTVHFNQHEYWLGVAPRSLMVWFLLVNNKFVKSVGNLLLYTRRLFHPPHTSFIVRSLLRLLQRDMWSPAVSPAFDVHRHVVHRINCSMCFSPSDQSLGSLYPLTFGQSIYDTTANC